MATEIRCSNCGSMISIEEAVKEEYKQSLREQMLRYKKEQDELLARERENFRIKEQQLRDKAQREEENFLKKVQEERQRLQQELEASLRKSIQGDFENQLRILQQQQEDNTHKLAEARKKELEFMRKELELKNKESELELNLQRQLQEQQVLLADKIRREEMERNAHKETQHQLRLKELEKQLDDQKKLAEEMRRKAEQGSMQLQGEAQELLLEELLREFFPMDTVEEVSKGVEGADCILIVRNHLGVECGKIIFESKRAKNWNNAWVDKLKADMRSQQADLAILVTQCYPKGMDCFGERDGVWLCSFKEVSGLAAALRNAIIRIAESRKSEENKGEKMHLLYNYLTGVEFRGQIEAIVEGFLSMKNSITRERMQMEKIWKEREKQLDKVLINTSGMYGSIKGIAGASVGNIPLLEDGEDEQEADQETT